MSISRNWFEWVSLIKLLNLLIALVGPWWLMANYLWGDRKKPTLGRRFSKPVVDVDDNFELDFQGFKDDDESNIDEEDEVLDFVFRGRFDEEDEKNVFFFFFFFLQIFLFFF